MPNDKELFFPTCLSNLDNILVVGIGGNNFNSKIFVYDITDIHKIKLINTIHLGNKIKAPPSGILVYENFLIVTFYLTNTLKVFDLSKNNKVVFNQTNSLLGKPLSLTKYKDIVFISSHANNSIIMFDFDGFKELKIQNNFIDSPWGICSLDDTIYIANMGLKKNQPPFISSFKLNNLNALKFDLNSITKNELLPGINQLKII